MYIILERNSVGVDLSLTRCPLFKVNNVDLLSQGGSPVTSCESNNMGSKAEYVLLLMLAMSLEVALANSTESVDLFSLLDETCPYW